MPEFRCKIGKTEFTLNDLGKPLNEQFKLLHRSFLRGKPFNYATFERECHSYFDRNPQTSPADDLFFNNFTVIWRALLELKRFKSAEEVWNFALDCTYSYEESRKGQRRHKGTPYYFWGMTAILEGNIEKGVLLMHQALDEDIKTTNSLNPDTAARAFVFLDYGKQEQAFRYKVQEIASFLEKFLAQYRAKRKGQLTIDMFRSRFLEDPNLRDAAFAFVFVLFKIESLLKKELLNIRKNDFAGLLESGVIFDLCLILDAAIHYKNSSCWKFIDHAARLSSERRLSLTKDRLVEINSAYNKNFGIATTAVLGGSFSFLDGSRLSDAEGDIAVAYGFRNLGAHELVGAAFIYENFEVLVQRVLSSIFMAIECMYP